RVDVVRRQRGEQRSEAVEQLRQVQGGCGVVDVDDRRVLRRELRATRLVDECDVALPDEVEVADVEVRRGQDLDVFVQRERHPGQVVVDDFHRLDGADPHTGG